MGWILASVHTHTVQRVGDPLQGREIPGAGVPQEIDFDDHEVVLREVVGCSGDRCTRRVTQPISRE